MYLVFFFVLVMFGKWGAGKGGGGGGGGGSILCGQFLEGFNI